MATILIVDDRETNREFLISLLGYQGHRLLQARDGAEGLELARIEHCDLVITDILMPTMDGYEFVRRLRAEPVIAGTKVIFYTAHYREQQAKSLALACGVQEVLVKPCEPEQVLRTVAMMLSAQPGIAIAPPREFTQEHLRLVTDKASQKTGQLRIASQRLSILIEIDLQLASERDPGRLIERFCRSARELVGAKYACAAAGHDTEASPDHFAISGMDAQTAATIDTPVLNHGIPGTVLLERKPRRLARLEKDSPLAGLPSQHPEVHSLLCAPVTSPMRAYGWVCVTDKLGADEFNEEDEQVLAMLAALVGRIYENGSLYADIRRHAELLETEIGERKRSEAQIRVLNAELEQRLHERTVQLEAAIHRLEASGNRGAAGA